MTAGFASAAGHGRPPVPARVTLLEDRDLRVCRVVLTLQMSPVTQDSLAIEYVIDVGVQKKLPADGADAAIDELLVLVEAIADHLRFKRLEGFPDAAWVGISNEPVVSSEAARAAPGVHERAQRHLPRSGGSHATRSSSAWR